MLVDKFQLIDFFYRLKDVFQANWKQSSYLHKKYLK